MTAILQNLFLNNWQSKIAALLVAIAVWYLVKSYQSASPIRTTPVPGEAPVTDPPSLTSPVPGPDTTALPPVPAP
ncbi:MAG: hypothetical protein HKN23_00875 [Verrucomicrobiales bacterium]|nr:hypothetical protein [Verrucomicrobiales bacterium]